MYRPIHAPEILSTHDCATSSIAERALLPVNGGGVSDDGDGDDDPAGIIPALKEPI